MPTVDLLLVHGTVVTMDADRRILDDGAVAITGDRIVAVGPVAELARDHTGQRTLDCRGKLVMPGLIDCHGHAGHSLIKNLAADTPSFWMPTMTRMYFHAVTDDYWYIEGLLSALERLKFGVTCGVSVIGSQPRSDDPVFAGNHARAYVEVGLREVVAVGPCAPPWPHPVGRWVDGRHEERQISFEAALDGAEAVTQTWHGAAGGRIRVFITPFTIVPSLISNAPTPPDVAPVLEPHDREQARRIREIAARRGVRIHSDAFGGMVRLAAQDDHGLLGPDVHLQHCFGLSHEEVRILAETDTRVSHSPGATGQLRGRCPVVELLEAGVTVAITTDGTSPRQPFDLFPAMRAAQAIQQLQLRDPFVLPPGKLLEMVTIDAARTLGCEDELGSLETGKLADVIVVNLRQPHLAPAFMPVHRLVYAAVGQDVETVIVAGRLVMENRRVVTVDEPAILDAAQREALANIERAGLAPHLNPPVWGKARLTFDRPVPSPEPR